MSTGVRQFGFWMAVALVIGNMIGSGLYLLPASLAPFGSASLLGWAITGVGAILLAIVFARLSLLLPQSGGPYVFVRAAFGDAPGFLVAWGYWISIWSANAAIAVAFAGAVQKLVPAWSSAQAGMLIALAAIWCCTAFNLRGVGTAGRVQLLTTILKLTPLIALLIWATVRQSITPQALPAMPADSGMSLMQAAQASAALCLWAFVGLESATIAAGLVRDPERTVPRATLIGTVVAIVVTVAACTMAMLLVPLDVLKDSSAPFVDAASALWSPQIGVWFAAAAAIAAFGTLNGWVMMQGQIPLAVAQDGLFPKRFARTDAHGTPAFGLLFGSVLASLLTVANFNEGLVAAFTFTILLSTAATLVPYALCAAALIRLQPRGNAALTIIALLALAYSLWALVGIGADGLLWGAALFACGVPVYALMRRSSARAD